MKHYYELDSLRGLAAVSVLFSHVLSTMPGSIVTTAIEYGPLRPIVAGSEGVILFFILSGFVLYLPFSIKRVEYSHFVIKRFFRIYVPYFIATLFAFMASIFLYSGRIEELSDWFNGRWDDPFDLNMLAGHLSLIGSFDMGELNPVIWSLVHEFRISLIFPLIMFIVLKYNGSSLLIISFGITILSALLYYSFPIINTDLIQSIYYTHMFLIGSTLSKYRDELIKMARKLTKAKARFLFSIALFCYFYMKPSFVLNIILPEGIDIFYRSIIDGYFTVLGAGLIIIFALSSVRLSKFLLNEQLSFLGKISYSLYLYHCISLLVIIHTFNSVLPIWLCVAIAVVISFILATISYVFVEIPAINAGKRLIKFNSQRGTKPAA